VQTYWQGKEIFRQNHPNGLYGKRNNGGNAGIIGLAGVFGIDG
jgi:hypothetical protein